MTDIGEIALGTGVTGQDGAFPAGSLRIVVRGLRLSASFDTGRLELFPEDPRPILHFGDMTRSIPRSRYRLAGTDDLLAEMVRADPTVAARSAAVSSTSLPHG